MGALLKRLAEDFDSTVCKKPWPQRADKPRRTYVGIVPMPAPPSLICWRQLVARYKSDDAVWTHSTLPQVEVDVAVFVIHEFHE